MNEEIPNYYAIIPANVRYDKELIANAKLLYGEITALCNDKGFCWATNEYFANLYNVSKTSISKWISNLARKGYISIDIEYKEGTKEILNRYLRIVKYPIEEKLNTPIEEKLKENNTYINNTNNIKENNKRKDSKPSLEEIENYINEKNLHVDAKQFYDYFEEGNWIDSKGNKVKNWKQKLLTWEKFNFNKKQEKPQKEFLMYNEDLNSLYEN